MILVSLILACACCAYAQDGAVQPPAEDAPKPADAVIVKDLEGGAIERGEALAIRCEASSPDGGTLGYQWYYSFSPNLEQLVEITGETSDSFTVGIDLIGTIYFCCEVRNYQQEVSSDPVYTNMAAFRITDHLEDLKVDRIEIEKLPEKTVYEKGEELDPEGLDVRVYDSYGYYDLRNGERVKLDGYDSELEGMQTVTASLADKTATFEVTVNGPAEEEPEKPKASNDLLRIAVILVLLAAALILILLIRKGRPRKEHK